MALDTKEKKTCFVIGPIGKAGSETRRDADFLLNGIIRPAIEKELDLNLWRADEDNRPGMITDKVINDINDSDLVIADLSELNPNAFYELGIRHSVAKPTIHMAAIGTHLPFDNLGHRTIFFDKADWTSIETAKGTLLNQAKMTLGDDYEVSSPVTQALNAKAFRASASSTDNAVAQMMKRIENLENNKINSENKKTEKDEIIDVFYSDIYIKMMKSHLVEGSLISETLQALKTRYPRIVLYDVAINERWSHGEEMIKSVYVPF